MTDKGYEGGRGSGMSKSWLWPDRVINKNESRSLREEHNDLVNSHAELLEALEVAHPTHPPGTAPCSWCKLLKRIEEKA